jgi:hypothetical protein
VGIPTLVGTPIRRLCARQVALSLEQQPKLRGGRWLSTLVGTTESRLGILGRSSILAAHVGHASIVGFRALFS